MSLKNVLMLAGIYSKANRLITKKNFRHYREKRWEAYAIYALAIVIGGLLGSGFGYLYTMAPGPADQELFRQYITGFFVALPTAYMLFSLYLTMNLQIKRTGVKASVQPIYWFPVTWAEHTAASVLSSTYGGTLWFAVLLCSGMLAGSAFTGLLPLAVLTSIAVFLSLALMGMTMEAFRILQAGISGLIAKAAGKAAVWVRFFTTIGLFIVVFTVYFSAQQSMATALNTIAQGQLTVWFIPYMWPGIALYTFSHGMIVETVLLSLGSIAFAVALFAIAVKLNSRYGLSDAPTLRVASAYAPNAGRWSRVGISPAESAVVKKDFRAFTRRNELMYIFIAPIMLILVVFMPLVTGKNSFSLDGLGSMRTLYFLYIAIIPPVAMAQSLGISVVGAEGERWWLLATSPMPVKSFVRAKFLFQATLCTAIALICGVAGYLIFMPTARVAATGFLEAFILAFTIAIVSLSCGIAGADFRESPRPRMIRWQWSLISLCLNFIVALLILLPVLVYGIAATFGAIVPSASVNGAYLYAAWLLSGAIALTMGYLFYRRSIKYADKLLGAVDQGY